MSSIEFNDDNLAPVDYEEYLKAIRSALKKLTEEKEQENDERKREEKEYIFLSPTTFSCDIDKVADAVARQYETSNHYPFELRDGLSYATIHALDINEKTEFSQEIRQVIDELRTQMLDRVGKKQNHRSLERYTPGLLAPIEKFIGQRAMGLAYPLDKDHRMEKRSLHADNNDKTSRDCWLKGHKLTLSVTNIDSFTEQVAKSIEAYVEHYPGCDEDDIADVHESLVMARTQESSNLNQLKDIIIKESVARIHREACVRYLRYLLQGMQEWEKEFKQKGSENAQNLKKGIQLLSNLIRRLNWLDAYIRQPGKEYSYYTVFLSKEEFNYRELFAPAHSYSALPIISEIDGFLGESTDQLRKAKTFTSGVKLKFNGQVHNHGGNGRPVFDFNLALLDPATPEYKIRSKGAREKRSFREKVLRVALLYCFVFLEMENKDFRPDLYFEKEILPALRSNDDKQVRQVFLKIKNGITGQNASANLNLLRDQLLEFLRRGNVGPAQQEVSLALVLDKSILTKDINQIIQGNFFQENFDSRNGRNALKYISITNDVPDANTLSKLPLKMVFEPIYYHPKDKDPEHFMMRAETEGLQVLPTFLVPVDNDAPAKYKTAYKDISRISFYYRHRPEVPSDSARAFVYRFVYTLLAYTIIKLLVESLPGEQRTTLFTPLICIHAQDEQIADEKGEKYDDETFMHMLSKQLAHMLGEDHLSGSQGFHLETIANNANKLGNALYSLYSALPHTFRPVEVTAEGQIPVISSPHHLNKLAVIVVSSRKSDENLKSPDAYEATIIGKVIGIERQEDGAVKVQTLTTFSANQNSRDLFSRPDVIIEQVKKYSQQGYLHFLYVARAPYTRTLNVSDAGNKELFFMNKDIIQAMRQVDSRIKVYPVFCNKYHVIDRKAVQTAKPRKELLKADSLYIDDIGELTAVSNDPSRRSQIFFNLFNGIKVNFDAIYNGVMSYATLIYVYDNDPTYDQYIWNELLNTATSDNLRAEILEFITLFHFSRYEKASLKTYPVGFKLDPYTDIIGDKSVGTLSVFPNMNGRARFNSLAFLTVMRAVMHTSIR
jgi:hypothetical protein